MKRINRKLTLIVFVVLSIIVFTGSAWSAITYPTARLNGELQWDDNSLTFTNVFLSRIDYDFGGYAIRNGSDESVIGSQILITGATRTGPSTFSNAYMELRNPGDSFQYLTATLKNIAFEEIYPDVYYLNLGLDADYPDTSFNLADVVLNNDSLHPSKYIDLLKSGLGTDDILGMKIGMYGDVTANGTGKIFDGLISGPASKPVPEPSSLILLLSGGATLGVRLYRKKKGIK